MFIRSAAEVGHRYGAITDCCYRRMRNNTGNEGESKREIVHGKSRCQTTKKSTAFGQSAASRAARAVSYERGANAAEKTSLLGRNDHEQPRLLRNRRAATLQHVPCQQDIFANSERHPPFIDGRAVVDREPPRRQSFPGTGLHPLLDEDME